MPVCGLRHFTIAQQALHCLHTPILPPPVASVQQELVCAGSVSGALLPALAGGQGTTAAQASQALFNQLAKDLLAGERSRDDART